MKEEKKKCMVCGKLTIFTGPICESCQDRIRREAMGEQADVGEQADKELKKHGVTPSKKSK